MLDCPERINSLTLAGGAANVGWYIRARQTLKQIHHRLLQNVFIGFPFWESILTFRV